MALKGAIFDLNGVFILSPKLSNRFEADFGVSASVFLPKLSEIMAEVRKPGAGRAFTYWEPVLTEWNVPFTEEAFWKYWFGDERPSEEMVALAKELREKGIQIITLSNNFKERAEHYGHYPWLREAVDTAYFSWQTGFVKPDLRAWTHALEEKTLSPEDVVYFDDQQQNLDAAESLSITSFLFESPAQARAVIEERLN